MRCICVGGGDFASEKFVYDKGDLVIAADSGYEKIKDRCEVDYIVGDFDSLGYTPTGDKVVKFNTHKDNTDMLEACNIGYEKGARDFVLYGALGKRLDHTLANLQNAKGLVEKGCTVLMQDINSSLYVINKELVLKDFVGKTVSIFSFDETVVSLKGFEYSLEKYKLTNGYALGVSNVVTSETAMVEVDKGCLIVIINDRI